MRNLLVNAEKNKVKAIYNNKEDIPMGLGGKGGSGGTGGGEAGQDGKSVNSGYTHCALYRIDCSRSWL